MTKISLDAPNIGKSEKISLNRAIDQGFVSTFGPFTPEFERKFAKYVRTKNAASTQNGTAALHIALYELEITEGDEVIVPVLTFIGTANPVTYLGAKPVFVDVDIHTWNIDPMAIEKNITKNTKAIIPVHLYGNPCDMDSIMRIAKKYHLHVVEDATESLGATFRKKHTGTFGDFGCFSFNGNKVITTGGGGMVVGKDSRKIDHIHFLVNQARDESRGYYHPEIGFNYRMTNIQAALGLAQMDRLGEFFRKKSIFRNIYKEELKGVDCIDFQGEYQGSKGSLWFTCIKFNKSMDIGALQKRLSKKGIPTRRTFMPITEFPPYLNKNRQIFKNAYHIYERTLCLPSSTINSPDDIRYICKAIKEMV